MSDVFERYEAWHEKAGLRLGLAAGASEADIAAAERRMGRAFPPDFRAWLARHDGQASENDGAAEFVRGCNWLASVERIAEEWSEEAGLAEEFGGSDDTQCEGRVKNAVYSAARIPIAGTTYWDGDKTYVDYAPGPAGTQGQIIALVTECDFTVLAPSFSDLLERYLALLDSGALVVRDGKVTPANGKWAHPADWLAEHFAALGNAEPKPAPAKPAPAKPPPAKPAPAKPAPAKPAPATRGAPEAAPAAPKAAPTKAAPSKKPAVKKVRKAARKPKAKKR